MVITMLVVLNRLHKSVQF